MQQTSTMQHNKKTTDENVRDKVIGFVPCSFEESLLYLPTTKITKSKTIKFHSCSWKQPSLTRWWTLYLVYNSDTYTRRQKSMDGGYNFPRQLGDLYHLLRLKTRSATCNVEELFLPVHVNPSPHTHCSINPFIRACLQQSDVCNHHPWSTTRKLNLRKFQA